MHSRAIRISTSNISSSLMMILIKSKTSHGIVISGRVSPKLFHNQKLSLTSVFNKSKIKHYTKKSCKTVMMQTLFLELNSNHRRKTLRFVSKHLLKPVSSRWNVHLAVRCRCLVKVTWRKQEFNLEPPTLLVT